MSKTKAHYLDPDAPDEAGECPNEQDLLASDPAYQELAETNNEGMSDKEIHAGF